MKITYIYHSGFCVELEHSVLLFDYYKGELPEIPDGKRVCFFASHVHPDHFSFSIFQLAQQFSEVSFFLSNDIHRKYNEHFFMKKGVTPEQYEQIVFLKADTCYEENGIRICTVDSTDVGVAFYVEAEEKHFFHAGDLNWWSWEGASEQEERLMAQKFRREVAKLKDRRIDYAFLPLDSRQEQNYYLGFDYYMRELTIGAAYPMHYWEDASVIRKLKAMSCSEQYRNKIIETE